MGKWGTELYENDVALEVKDMIEEILDNSTSKKQAIQRILAILDKEYIEEDDSPIAWIVAADQLLSEANANIVALWHQIQDEGNGISKDDICEIRKKLQDQRLWKKRSRARNVYRCQWNVGDIFVVNLDPKFQDDTAFSGWTIGFLCIDFYEYRGKHPIVYVFRCRAASEELKQDPDLIFSGEFWRISNRGEKGFTYRTILWAREFPIPEHRVIRCGNTSRLPKIIDECMVYDKASIRSIYWDSIEESLLVTKVLMDYGIFPKSID